MEKLQENLNFTLESGTFMKVDKRGKVPTYKRQFPINNEHWAYSITLAIFVSILALPHIIVFWNSYRELLKESSKFFEAIQNCIWNFKTENPLLVDKSYEGIIMFKNFTNDNKGRFAKTFTDG